MHSVVVKEIEMGYKEPGTFERLFDFFNFHSEDKYGVKVWKNNCMNCIYQYALKFNVFFSAFSGKCSHQVGNFQGETKFKFTRSHVLLPTLFIISNLFGSVLYLYKMLISCSGDRLSCLLELHDHLLIISTIILLMIVQFKLNVRAEELNYLSDIIGLRKYFGISNMIDARSGKAIYMITHLSYIGSVIFFFIFCLFSYGGDDVQIFNYHEFCFFICQSAQVAFACQVSQKLVTVRVMYRSVHLSVKKRLYTKKKSEEKIGLEDYLRRTIHLYLNLKVIMIKICDFMNPTIVVWLISHIALCVFNFFALVQVMNRQPAYLVIFAQVKTTITFLVIISVFSDCQQVVNQVSIRFII